MKLVVPSIIAFVVLAACSSHYDLVTPNTADAGATDSGATPTGDAATPSDDAGSNAVDATTPVVDAGPPEPPPIGTGCAVARTPAPRLCEDFEGTVDQARLVSEEGATVRVVTPGSSSSKGLEITCQDGAGGSLGSYAYTLDGKNARVTWSFDLRMDAKVFAGTQLTVLAIDGIDTNGLNGCALGVIRTTDGFHVSEVCNYTDGVSGAPIMDVAVPSLAASTWWNVLADVDLAEQTFRLAVRTDASSPPIEQVGRFTNAVASSSEQLIVGVYESAGTTPNSDVEVDNIVASWK